METNHAGYLLIVILNRNGRDDLGGRMHKSNLRTVWKSWMCYNAVLKKQRAHFWTHLKLRIQFNFRFICCLLYNFLVSWTFHIIKKKKPIYFEWKVIVNTLSKYINSSYILLQRNSKFSNINKSEGEEDNGY